MNILVIEDDHDAADTLAQCLRLAHCGDTEVAYSATQAGDRIRGGFEPDVVFLDLVLPDLSGFTLAKQMCAALPRKPLVVAVTGYDEADDRCEQEGVDVHFLKPVDPQDLINIVETRADQAGP